MQSRRVQYATVVMFPYALQYAGLALVEGCGTRGLRDYHGGLMLYSICQYSVPNDNNGKPSTEGLVPHKHGLIMITFEKMKINRQPSDSTQSFQRMQ